MNEGAIVATIALLDGVPISVLVAQALIDKAIAVVVHAIELLNDARMH